MYSAWDHCYYPTSSYWLPGLSAAALISINRNMPLALFVRVFYLVVYFNQERIEVRRVRGHTLLAIAFLINIPLQAGISVYGLVYAIRAFIDGGISAGILDIPVTIACVAIAHFAVGLVLAPLNDRAAFLLNRTDVETTGSEQAEWERRQIERGYVDRRRSLLDVEVQHIKDSIGISGDDLAGSRRRRGG